MEVRAIDTHTHPSTSEYLDGSLGPIVQRTREHFKSTIPVRTIDEMAEEYRKQGIIACVAGFDAETSMGVPATSNDLIAEMVKRHPDVFIGFAGIDPWKGELAVMELERAIKELGLHGVGELHPIMNKFYPNDRRFYPLYEKCTELGVHVAFHTGTTGVGSGTPGGGGFRLDYSRPIYIDDVAVDFPNLTIICCHPSIPWVDELLAIVTHKANVYMDISGWHPRYLSEHLLKRLNSDLQDKVMFGTDYPWITPGKWLSGFEKLTVKDEVRQKVLKDNAISRNYAAVLSF
jgi:predicted TIM-barrel fold metal-dependent hydrolase